MTFNLFSLTGNVAAKRIGKLFPTGWTPVIVNGRRLVATLHTDSNARLGTDAVCIGTIELREMMKAQVTHASWMAA